MNKSFFVPSMSAIQQDNANDKIRRLLSSAPKYLQATCATSWRFGCLSVGSGRGL